MATGAGPARRAGRGARGRHVLRGDGRLATAHCPQDARARLGFTSTGALPIRPVPTKDTLRRLLLMTSPQAWAALVTGHAAPVTHPKRLAADT